MNGTNPKYFLDTNCIIHILQTNDETLLNKLSKAEWIGVSIISKLEFLSFPGITDLDKKLFQSFLQMVEVINICSTDCQLIETIISLRSKRKLKLPDSIIIASSISNNATLLTRDKQLLSLNNCNIKEF